MAPLRKCNRCLKGTFLIVEETLDFKFIVCINCGQPASLEAEEDSAVSLKEDLPMQRQRRPVSQGVKL